MFGTTEVTFVDAALVEQVREGQLELDEQALSQIKYANDLHRFVEILMMPNDQYRLCHAAELDDLEGPSALVDVVLDLAGENEKVPEVPPL